MLTSNPVLNIYQIEFLLHRSIYHENRLIGKIKEIQEHLFLNEPILAKEIVINLLEPSIGLIFNDNNAHDFIFNICAQFPDLMSIKFRFDNKTEQVKNLVTDQGMVVYQWKITKAGLELKEDWKPELFHKDLLDYTKSHQKTDNSFLSAIKDLLTDQQKIEIYYEKLMSDNPTIFVEWN